MLHPLIGHKVTLNLFNKLISNSSVPHGILLSGPDSIGKRRLAIEIGIKLLGIEEDSSEFKLLERGEHPDFYFVHPEDGKKNIRVDQIRDLKIALSRNPYYGNGSVAIINDAHKMNIAAANTLLKTLEEPEKNKFIILISDCPQLLPDTVISRSHQFISKPLEQKEIAQIISNLSLNKTEPETLAAVAKYANGSLSLFNLKDLINPKTLEITDIEKFNTKVEELLSKIPSIIERIKNTLFFAKSDKALFYAQFAQLTSSFEKDPDLELFWQLLLKEVRDLAIKDEGYILDNQTRWSDVLIRLIEVKNEIYARNLNFSIQAVSNILEGTNY